MSQANMNLALFLVTIVVMIIAMSVTAAKEKAKKLGNGIQVERAKYHKRYVYYMNNVITRKRFRRIVRSYSSMMCFDYHQLKKESVKTFEKAVLISLAFPIIGMVAFKDVILTAMLLLVAYVYYDKAVDNAIDKQEIEVRKALSFTLQSIRDTYSVTDNIPRAVIGCDRPACLEKPITKIYEILTDEQGERLLKEFKRTNPVRILGTLASTCYTTNNDGDLKSDDGASAFKDELTVLRQEADAGVRKLTKVKLAFKSLSWLSLVGLGIIPFAHGFLMSQIPGTSVYLKGVYGSVTQAITILLTLVAYYLISIMSRPSVVNQVDKNEWIDKLSKDQRIRGLLDKLQPKKFKTRQKLTNLINGSLSSKNIQYIYTCKMVMACVAMISMTVCLVVFTVTAKYALWNNHGSLSFSKESSQGWTEEMYERLLEIDEEYMTQDYKMSDDDAAILVSAKLPSLTDMEREQQVDRLSTKWDYYYKITFKWWYVILVYLAGIVGWFGPEISLSLRKFLVKFEAVEDVMQLQTTMLTLSNTKMDVYKALRWLMTESIVHKAVLRFAWLSYPSDPEKSLAKLKSSVTERDMKRMVSKLEKAVYSLSLKEAFSDIALDKNQSLVINEMLQDEQIQSKTQYAKMVCNMTLMFSLFANFVFPILLLGFNQIISAMTMMNQ